MKIYVSHSRDFDFESELYKPLRAFNLNSQHQFFLPHEEGRSVDTQEEIKNSDLVLAEVSFPSTGQGVELGWANMLKVPIVCVSKAGSKVSGSLKYLTQDFAVYSDVPDLISKIDVFLSSR